MDKTEASQAKTYLWGARHLVGPAATTPMLSTPTHWGAILRGAPAHILADYEHMNLTVTTDPALIAAANAHPGEVLHQDSAGQWVVIGADDLHLS